MLVPRESSAVKPRAIVGIARGVLRCHMAQRLDYDTLRAERGFSWHVSATYLALLDASGVPIAAPSANRSSRISPTTASDVAEELAGRVSLILDGGPCPIGLESTVVGFENDKPVLLRSGAISREEIERIAGPLGQSQNHMIHSPGQMASHYAPSARLRLNASDVSEGEVLLAFGPNIPPGTNVVRNLSTSGDLREAAANFFAMLRALDKSGAKTIAVMPIPNEGLGQAINDRLLRGAAPRE